MSRPFMKPACIDLDTSDAATQALGRVPSETVAAHRAACTGCELERLAFESLDEHAAQPSPWRWAWVRAVARKQGVPPQ